MAKRHERKSKRPTPGVLSQGKKSLSCGSCYTKAKPVVDQRQALARKSNKISTSRNHCPERGYNDIDLDNDIISVTKSVYHVNNRPFIKEPKTQKGIRNVPILYPLKPYLPNKKSQQYIFSLDGGKTPLTEMQYQKLWKEYAKSIGINCSAHQLRHSFATMLFECGVDAKDAQDILGHAQLSTTMDIYTHIRDSRRKDVASKINEKLKALE